MNQHKNAIMIIVAIILFIYAGMISIFPYFITKSFNIDQFEQKVFEATSLVTTIDSFDYTIKPNFDTVITIRNWSSKYIDEQNCFDARQIQLTTTPFAIFTKNFKIKDLYLKNVKYADQTLPEGQNKLAFLPEAFNSNVFGTNNIKITTGPIRIKNYQKIHIAPNIYKENNYREMKYSKDEVKNFLSQFTFNHITIN